MMINMSCCKYFSPFVIMVLLLSFLSAEIPAQRVLFGVDKNRTKAINNLLKVERIFSDDVDAKRLKKRYSLEYKEVSYGDYYAIAVYPIKSNQEKESLVLLLQPYFDDIFTVNNEHREGRNEKSDLPLVKTNEISSKEGNFNPKYMQDSLAMLYGWLEKWHAIIVLLLLGGFFYHRRHRQLSRIATRHRNLIEHQAEIEQKLK